MKVIVWSVKTHIQKSLFYLIWALDLICNIWMKWAPDVQSDLPYFLHSWLWKPLQVILCRKYCSVGLPLGTVSTSTVPASFVITPSHSNTIHKLIFHYYDVGMFLSGWDNRTPETLITIWAEVEPGSESKLSNNSSPLPPTKKIVWCCEIIMEQPLTPSFLILLGKRTNKYPGSKSELLQ